MTDSQLEMFEERHEVTVAELDELAKMVKEARAEHEKKEAIASEAGETVILLEEKLKTLMEMANKTSYKVSGVGTISLVNKLAVTVPKDPMSKRELFKWILQEYGQEGLDKYQTVNYQSLNSLYNEYQQQCEIDQKEFEGIPGLDQPTVKSYISIRKEK
jgi:hypothetical protein